MYLKSSVNIMITLSIAISLDQNALQAYIMDLINLFSVLPLRHNYVHQRISLRFFLITLFLFIC